MSCLKLALKIFLITASTFIVSPIAGKIYSGNDDNANNLHHEDILDNGNYLLSWDTDLELNTIAFQVTVKTTGYIGFGISENGGMENADMIMGGVFPNGTTYFADYYGTGNQSPIEDEKQDWELLEASENGTHTMLKFKRLFNTCDKNDFKIGNDTSNLIWALGDTDEISYHIGKRGSIAVNLLDPPMPSLASNSSIWRVSTDFEIPAEDTTYFCTVHKGPSISSKQHMIGFEAYLPTETAKKFTHHFILHECRAQGSSVEEFKKLIDPLVNSTGDHCYQPGKIAGILANCQQYLLVWATGGKRVVFPERVGYPINENDETYYMLQVHYNNPDKLAGVRFETGVNIFYTSELREFDAATLLVGYDVFPTHIIPPKVKSFVTGGHCSFSCTKENIPKSGLNVFNVLLHSHLAGRRMKLRQFRDGKEMPWIANDENYSFDFQQNRPMGEEIKILPGDHLTIECEYSTSDRETVTLGGLSSQDEMNQAFIMYYPRIDLMYCGSSYPVNATLEEFGLEKMDWIMTGISDANITAPENLAGQSFKKYLSGLDWNADRVADFEKKTRFGTHTSKCYSVGDKYGDFNANSGDITYPSIKEEFVPFDSCKAN